MYDFSSLVKSTVLILILKERENELFWYAEVREFKLRAVSSHNSNGTIGKCNWPKYV